MFAVALQKIEKDGTASLGAYSVSETGQYLAYGVQRSGSDWQTVYVRVAATAGLPCLASS